MADIVKAAYEGAMAEEGSGALAALTGLLPVLENIAIIQEC